MVIGDLVLWDGPLGKTVGGTHTDLFEKVSLAPHTSKTHFSRSMRATGVKYQELSVIGGFKAETKSMVADKEFHNWWKWDSIGAACRPKCGGCRCGNCQPGGKEMILSKGGELVIIKKDLGYKRPKTGSEDCKWLCDMQQSQCQQIMSDLPSEQITPAKPFQYTSVDLFGPYEVKDEVKKKARLKVWGRVFCRMASRALHSDVVSDQSSEGFLLAYKRFTVLRGHPKKMWSDAGKNFVGARRALKELYAFLKKLETSKVENEASKHGTEWSWKLHPADSPHRNGAAEAAVRRVKRALHNLYDASLF
ncbi:uncharacterized protein LOC133492908 [Syngnathoides biaculeatus]|uniref:uncharacterized protein LOC133492908 n=1 Tax=Syngnathoides biaculeatus TaxID=300417 RepID=UPI002ADE6831|nr:uncharacterized protein LOC133492908 [Syngnathoides biaculeatus]